MQSGMITVTGAIISANGVTLFQPNGQSLVLPQSDYRTRDILEATMGKIAKGETSVEINLDDFSLIKRIEKALPDAVVTTVNGATTIKTSDGVIENVQELESKLAGASSKGVSEFIRKTALQQRKHSTDELRTFLKRGDLPIADDGTIICYKILDKPKTPGGPWLDCHSKKIPQHLGAVVEMPLEEIDENRRQACSTGLHVCTVGYVRDFHGNDRTITLVKVQPYDVIAVPVSEQTKMRAMSYHIVAEIPAHLHAVLSAGKGLEADPEGAALLAEVVAGRHTGITEYVKVVNGVAHVVSTGREATPIIYNKNQVARRSAYVDPKEVRKALAAGSDISPAAAINAALQPGHVKAPAIEQKRVSEDRKSPAPAALNHPAVTTRVTEIGPKPLLNDEYEAKFQAAVANIKAGMPPWKAARKMGVETNDLRKWIEERRIPTLPTAPIPKKVQEQADRKMEAMRADVAGKPDTVFAAYQKTKKPKKPAKDAPYEKRLAYAQWMFEQNISLRQIAAELGMDRKSLTKKLRKD